MKRRTYAYEPRNNRLYGFAAMGLVTALVVFLLVYPSVEREAYLVDLRSGVEDDWDGALLHVCWIRSGQEGVDVLLDEATPARRIQIVQHAADLGCLSNLAPRHQVVHWLHNAQALHRVAGHGMDALPIVLEALEMEAEGARTRGEAAALALLPSLPPTERARLQAMALADAERYPVLAEALNPPAYQLVAPKPVPANPAEEAARVDARRATGTVLAMAQKVALPPLDAVLETTSDVNLEFRLQPPKLEAPPAMRPIYVAPAAGTKPEPARAPDAPADQPGDDEASGDGDDAQEAP